MGRVLEVPRVAFDEAGNTGPNLLDLDQPVFVQASVLATDDVAAIPQGPRELKFSKLHSSARGRSEILRVLGHEALVPERFVVSGMHKRFMVVTKIVDLLYEPLAYAGGIDLYERGANLAMANLLYFTLPTFIGQALFDTLLEQFVAMIRATNDSSIDAFFGTVEQAYSSASPEHQENELGALLASRAIVEAHRDVFHPSDLDPAVPSFFLHASEWTGRLGSPFDILHDASKPIENEQLVLEAMMSLSESPEQVGYDRRKANFPLASTGIQLRDSRSEPAIQVADIIASAVSYVLRNSLGDRQSDFANELLETPVLQGTWAPVWPELKVTPQELGTDEPAPRVDPHEFMGAYVRERLGGIPPAGQRRKRTSE